MGFYRDVDQRTWGDRKFRALCDDGKLLWLYLLTGPEALPVPGCVGVGQLGLAEAMGWTPERMLAAFGDLEKQGMALADWGARFVWLPRGIAHRTPDNPKVVKSWIRYLDGLAESDLLDRAICAIWNHLQIRGEGFAEPFRIRYGIRYLERYPIPNPPTPSVVSDTGEGEGEGEVEGSVTSNSADAEPDPPALVLVPDEPEPAGYGPADLVADWNEHAAPGLPRVRDLTATRADRIRRRLREHPGRDWWLDVIDAVNASPFYRGEGRPRPGSSTPWRCTLDHLIENDTNALKVLERRDDSQAEPERPTRWL